jgi:hypothetical protein
VRVTTLYININIIYIYIDTEREKICICNIVYGYKKLTPKKDPRGDVMVTGDESSEYAIYNSNYYDLYSSTTEHHSRTHRFPPEPEEL